MTVVIDASLTIAAFAEEQDTVAAQAVMAEILRRGVWAPSLWKLEVANVLRIMVLRKRVETHFPDKVLAALSDMAISIDPETAKHAWSDTLALSREQDLTPYDAAYLELAVRRNAALATLDVKLAAAARRLGSKSCRPKARLEIAPIRRYAFCMRIKALLALTAVAASLGACATVNRIDAGGDVHDLLVAIRDNDRATFEAHVDRRALKAQIEARLVDEARQRGGSSTGVMALAALAAGPLADVAGDALIRPETFHAAANYYGYTPDRPIPGRVAIASMLRPTGDGRVCAAKRDGPCLLTFTQEGATWRLTSFDAEAANLHLKR